MSQTLYHATLSENMLAIMSKGLLPDAPTRNFQCGRLVYMAKSPDDAKRWAGEIARSHDKTLAMSLLEVIVNGWTSENLDTAINVAQVVADDTIPVENITVIEEFNAEPVNTHARQIKNMGDTWWCVMCGTGYNSYDAIVEHCEMMDDEGVF